MMPAPSAETVWRRCAAQDGTEIAWRADGPAAAAALPVVLCNGIACDDGYWSDLVPLLAGERRTVRWCYRGHGASGSPADPAAVDVGTVVDDLAAVLDAARLPAAVLVGHSYGVQVVLEAARRLPGRVLGVVAVAGSAGHPLPASIAALTLPLIGGLVARSPELTRSLWHGVWGGDRAYWMVRAVGGTSRSAPREVLRDYCRHVDGLDLPAFAQMIAAMQAHDASDVLDVLDVPLLAVAGDADGVTPLATMRALALRAADGELVVLPGASHTLPAEQPERLAAELLAFLERLDTAAAATPLRA